MAKKMNNKNTMLQRPIPSDLDRRFSPKALMEMRLKERELQLSAHTFCENPYSDFDYTPFIY